MCVLGSEYYDLHLVDGKFYDFLIRQCSFLKEDFERALKEILHIWNIV